MSITNGQVITDGTAQFTVRSILSSSFPLGLPVFVPFNFVPEGFVNGSLGTIVARSLYPGLYNEITQKYPHLMLTEAAWQEYATANEGCCPFYSSGDGSTTFRLPKILYYPRASEVASKYGTFETDKQRNITGKTSVIPYTYDPSGAFSLEFQDPTANAGTGSGWQGSYRHVLDASKVVGTEHTGTEVQPKTIFGMYIIRAFDSVSNNENVDVQQVISAQTVTDGRVTALESTRAFNDKLSMPKGEYITIASTDTTVNYQAPSDGWVYIEMNPNNSTNAAVVLLTSQNAGGMKLQSYNGASYFGVYPIRKNAVATITKQYCTYNAYFLYAQSASVS